MEQLTKPQARVIIDDFAKEINQNKRTGVKPEKDIIKFRNEYHLRNERDVFLVSIGLLRYRKDNGRILSDVFNYEKNHGELLEKTTEAQAVIKKFLEQKDPEKTEELMSLIEHDGQREPAIITCDGFLINGNRRKMAMERLLLKHPGEPKFRDMKVVILPGKDVEGGPPTLLEIEEIENRYQLMGEGKAEYYGFDRALSIRKKISLGMTLVQQLRDDPTYALLPEKEFRAKVRKYEKDYLKPLECVDRYLEFLGRHGLYSTVSRGYGDKEGRWEAFKDYNDYVLETIQNEKKRMKYGINEDEVGDIEDVAFKIIRARQLKGLSKPHEILRKFPKWLSKSDSKRELLKMVDMPLDLSPEESFDKDKREYDERTKDNIWAIKHASTIVNQVKKAMHIYEHRLEMETPITRMDAALKHLNHEDMNPKNVRHDDFEKANQLLRNIRKRTDELEHEFYRYQKELKKLGQKK